MKHNLLKSLIISVILLTGVSNAWGWYVPGTIHKTRWDKADNNMHEDNAITFYAVPAGTYEFRLSDGNTLSGHQCISENKSTEIITNITTNGDNTKFTINETKDITIKVVHAQNWNVSIEATGPTYHIKAPWDGTNWSWKEFNNQGDGTYSLLNTYTNSKKYNYIKISSDDDTYKHYKDNATLVNSPSSTSDKCIYTFNPSDGSLEIRKCNTVNIPYHIYFDNSNANWPSNKLQFVVGHASYSRGHDLTSIANTKLYHVHITEYPWPDAGYYAIVSEPNTFGGGGWSRKNLIDNADHYSAAYLDPLNIEQNQSYLFKTEDANDGTPISITKKTQSSELNTTQTVQYVIAEYAGTPAIMNSGSTPGEISISSYKFIDRTYDAVSSVSANLAAQSNKYSTSFTAAQTATTTLKISEIDDAYQFDGWYDGNGTQLETDLTYTYYPTETKTIYARFSEKPCTVTLAGTDYGTYTVTCGEQEITVSDQETKTITNVPVGTTLTITNIHPNEGYDQTMIYSTDGENYTEFGQEKSMIVNSDIIISEDFRTTETHDIYLKINGDSYTYWINKDDEALPRILFVHGTNSKDQYLKSDGGNLEDKIRNFDRIVVTSAYNIYKITAPIGYHSFYLYPPHKYTASQLFDHKIILDNSIENCYELKDNETAGNGQWVGATITAKSTGADGNNTKGIGRYGIIYNGETRYATVDQNATFDIQVPYGGNIELRALKGEPGNEAYTGYLIMNDIDTIYFSNGATDTLMNINVTRDIEFDDFFVTKEPHIVYLGVPEGVKNSWQYNDNTNKSLAYAEHQYNTSKGAICLQEISTTKNGTTYYKFTIPAGWNNFRFELKSPELHDKYGNAPIHATIRFPYEIPTDEKNCFTLTGKEGYEFQGTWGKAPQCQVEMGYTNIGRYGIKDYTGEIHYATPGGSNTEFSVPYGSQVEVLEGEPGNDAYNGMVGLFNGNNLVKKFHDGQNQDNFVTITGYTVFDDLFISKAQHVVYLGVPNEGFDNWRLNDGERMTVRHLWPRDYIPSEYVNYEEMFVIDDITYYKFTLPQGLCSFQFSHRQQSNDSQISASRHFLYQIPVTEYNCFILENRQDGNLDYDGYWTKLPKPNVGDYRVLYAEKELIKTREEGESEDWETAFRTVYEHPSDIITKPVMIPQDGKEDTVSLHINTSQKRGDKTVHPMVILQKFQQIENNTYKWVNLQAHTVLPLKATGNMGMLPGRKKAFGDLPFYDDGIEAIKNDTTYSNSSRGDGLYKGSGVWNFVVNQASNGSVELDLSQTERYQGKYYIRTEALTNGWNNYKENLMTYSDYADYNSGFSHYFCKWLLVGNNVKFTIANDYAQSISDPLYGDATDLWGEPINYQMVERDQVLNQDANVRFAWYEMNNFVHRAYLSGSTHVQDRFLIVKDEEGQIFSHPQGTALLAGGDGSPRYGLKDNEEIFRDDANWIYHADIQIFPGSTATVIAQHYGKEQTFIKERTLVYGDDLGSMTNKYPVRLLYDFKINRLITGYIPNGDNETKIEPFTTNLMLIRKHHEQATQLLFNENKKTTQGAYGVMTFERDFLRNTDKSNKERAAYFISFPFDVKISDVFGFGQFYKHWFIQYYDGAARAKNGLWADTDTYWKHITDPNTVLEAHKGYALLFSLSNIEKSGVLDASKEISLYFPSTDNHIGNIKDANPEVTVDVPAHVCTIERENRKVKDSNWNLIGVPAYADVSGFVHKTFKDPYNNDVLFYWKRDPSTDQYTVEDASTSLTFQTMHAYMLQYAGVINWKAHTMSQPSQLIARRNTEQEASHTLRITLNQADKKLDQTYVRLQEEDATADFDMNKDQYKIKKAKANIYSLIQNAVGQIEAGANVLPLQTTIVPLGVIIKTAGEYTFSMPDGTDGIIAELIDYQTNTRTNLLLDNYTVTLPAGTNNSRFALSLQPDKTATSVENIGEAGNGSDGETVRKFIIDGKLYLQKDGVLYDAQGHAL